MITRLHLEHAQMKLCNTFAAFSLKLYKLYSTEIAILLSWYGIEIYHALLKHNNNIIVMSLRIHACILVINFKLWFSP